MDIRASWSAARGRRTLAVQADEGDLCRLLEEHGIPAARRGELTITEAHGLLRCVIETYLMEDRSKHDDEISAESASGEVQQYQAYQGKLLAEIKDRLGILDVAA